MAMPNCARHERALTQPRAIALLTQPTVLGFFSLGIARLWRRDGRGSAGAGRAQALAHPEQFAQDWALAQILPGPNVVNLSIMFGERHFGLRGAFAATAGMLLAPTLLVLLLGGLYLQYADHPAMGGALRGMGAVAAGLVLGTGLKLSASLHKHPLPLWLGWLLSMAAFAMVVVLRWPLWWVLPVVGGIGCAITWKRIAP